jgi:hypothetical protein
LLLIYPIQRVDRHEPFNLLVVAVIVFAVAAFFTFAG